MARSRKPKRAKGCRAPAPGHCYAWRLEAEDEKTVAHLVAVAAGSGRDDRGKRERIYANAKSLGDLYDKIEDAFSRDANFSEPKWAHGVEGATTMLAALTKAGKIAAETDTGKALAAEAERQFSRQPSARGRELPAKFNPALQLAKSWGPAMRSSSPRDARARVQGPRICLRDAHEPAAHPCARGDPADQPDRREAASWDSGFRTLARDLSRGSARAADADGGRSPFRSGAPPRLQAQRREDDRTRHGAWPGPSA